MKKEKFNIYKALREKCNIDVKTLCDALNITPEDMAEYENGKKEPTLEVSEKLSYLYSCPMKQFTNKSIPRIAHIRDLGGVSAVELKDIIRFNGQLSSFLKSGDTKGTLKHIYDPNDDEG